MIKGVNHLGIATKDLQAITELYSKILPDAPIHQTEIADQKVRVSSFVVGETHLEFLEPTSADSPIARFLENRDTGIHHIAFSTDNIDEELARLKEGGFRLIDEKPRTGFGGLKIAFLHPKGTGGLLMELCQEQQ
ncbi:MAG: methylmalonyl-CoA epimerase [Candidatus Xenobiia bacterium LiM19]